MALKFFRWQEGRQGTGYDKMLLATARWPVAFDAYLLRFPEGTAVPFHTDPAPAGQRRFRMNVFLRQAKRGGEFVTRSEVGRIVSWPRLELFRPDLAEHAVTRVEEGSRLVLSVGWLWAEK